MEFTDFKSRGLKIVLDFVSFCGRLLFAKWLECGFQKRKDKGSELACSPLFTPRSELACSPLFSQVSANDCFRWSLTLKHGWLCSGDLRCASPVSVSSVHRYELWEETTITKKQEVRLQHPGTQGTKVCVGSCARPAWDSTADAPAASPSLAFRSVARSNTLPSRT